MVEEIAYNTNKRISLIDFNSYQNAKYKNQKERLIKNPINSTEIYAFIGVLILLGITRKTHVSIEELWSENSIHYASFAVVALTREM